jgi:hypothetical protein
MSEDKVRTKDSCWSVGTIYDPRELPGVSTAGPGIGRGVTQDGLVAARQRSGQGSLNAEAAHRLPVEWTELIKCRGGTLPAIGMDRRRALSAINAEAARPRGLMSGSARWLTSHAPCHVAASGLRLSVEQRRIQYGLDTCRLRTTAWP